MILIRISINMSRMRFGKEDASLKIAVLYKLNGYAHVLIEVDKYPSASASGEFYVGSIDFSLHPY